MPRQPALRLPVLSEGAEHLVLGYLMRRNILAYKAPPNNEGYDLICIHPDPRTTTKQVRVQVKSRYATDSNRGVPVKSKTLDAFDFLVIVFQNIGFYNRKRPTLDGLESPEFYTLPVAYVREQHSQQDRGWEVFRTRHLELEPFKNEKGFELVAQELGVPYPSKGDQS